MRQLNAVKIEIGRQRGNYTIGGMPYPRAHGSDIRTLLEGWGNAVSNITAPNQTERAAIARWKAFIGELPPPLRKPVWDELFRLAALLGSRKAPVPPWAFTRPPSLFDAPVDTWLTERLGLLAALAVGAVGVGYLLRKSK